MFQIEIFLWLQLACLVQIEILVQDIGDKCVQRFKWIVGCPNAHVALQEINPLST